MNSRQIILSTLLVLALGGVAIAGAPNAAASDGTQASEESDGTNLCQFPNPEWRDAQTIAGVEVQESEHCRPDNPYSVATSVKGTNNVPMDVLMKTPYSRDAVKKCCDRDGDGDPDVIRITLEVNEVNGGTLGDRVAPGVSPTMWVFSPKTRGMADQGSAASGAIRAPSPPIRVEQGDTVYVTLENTHDQPHTIHFHGVDHEFEVNGSGNDGVPQTSEEPIKPGDSRTYKFTPREAGTMFYHCHVVPGVHVQMGLAGMFVVTEDEPDNHVQTFNIGAGKVRHPSAAQIDAGYEAVYDMQYQALDENLSEAAAESEDPRDTARQLNREHDLTDETPDYFLLNGRAFPFTLQESAVIVEPGEKYRLRTVNVGPGSVSLHTHGHKATIEAYDGVEVDEGNEVTRDVYHLSPAQRVDLTLNTTDDGLHSYGEGIWVMHDHREKAVTTDGISPGGGITAIVYESHLDSETGMPQGNTDIGRYFNASYYAGDIPLWAGLGDKYAHESVTSKPDPDTIDRWNYAEESMMRMEMREGGLAVNANDGEYLPEGCDEIRGSTEITVKAGEQFAEPGHMFSYDQRKWNVDTCTKVTVTLENADDVRHQWMLHGLPKNTYPMGMFNIEADGGEQVTATFVTPAEDTTLKLHCSLPEHEDLGMEGFVVVGDSGGETTDDAPAGDGSDGDTGGNQTLIWLGVVGVVGLLVGVGVVMRDEIRDMFSGN